MNTEITAAQKTALLKLPGFKEIQKQYAKEAKMEGGRIRRMRGRGFWDDVGDWFNQAGKDIGQFIRDTKIVSNVAAYALPILGAMGGALLTVNPLGATAGGIAGKSAADYIRSQGYGKMMGKGNDPLVINPPGQRMRGINPKSKMRGAGMRGGYSSEDALAVVRAITGRGGYGTTNNTFGSNGMPQKVTAPAHSGMMGNIAGRGKGRPSKMKGMGGTEYGTVSSEFGNVSF
jgi:hypothetical protein